MLNPVEPQRNDVTQLIINRTFCSIRNMTFLSNLIQTKLVKIEITFSVSNCNQIKLRKSLS